MNVIEIFEDSKKKLNKMFSELTPQEQEDNKPQFDKMIAEIDKNINELRKTINDASKTDSTK